MWCRYNDRLSEITGLAGHCHFDLHQAGLLELLGCERCRLVSYVQRVYEVRTDGICTSMVL